MIRFSDLVRHAPEPHTAVIIPTIARLPRMCPATLHGPYLHDHQPPPPPRPCLRGARHSTGSAAGRGAAAAPGGQAAWDSVCAAAVAGTAPLPGTAPFPPRDGPGRPPARPAPAPGGGAGAPGPHPPAR